MASEMIAEFGTFILNLSYMYSVLSRILGLPNKMQKCSFT